MPNIIVGVMLLFNTILPSICFDLDGVRFEVIPNKISDASIREISESLNAIECATFCGMKQGCFSMNFDGTFCSLLDEIFSQAPVLQDEDNSRYIRK